VVAFWVVSVLFVLTPGAGASTLRADPLITADAGSKPASGVRQLIKGAGVSGFNPKVFLLFLVLLPQFTDPAPQVRPPRRGLLRGGVEDRAGAGEDRPV
jgi:hypothetical protein